MAEAASAEVIESKSPHISECVRYDLTKMRGWTSVEVFSGDQPSWLPYAIFQCQKTPTVCDCFSSFFRCFWCCSILFVCFALISTG